MEILDTFDTDNGVVEIQMDDIGDSFKVVARYQGGALVNGYSYSIDKIAEIDSRQASELTVIHDMAVVARYDVESDAWGKYEQALKELGKLKENIMVSESVQLGSSRCECHSCIKENNFTDNGLPLSSLKMIVCSECGNKRCPHASDHRLACTNSNNPGQAGSIYQ